jgi:hypothetical protein
LTAPSIGPEWVTGGSGWPFFEKTALGSISRRGTNEIAEKPALPVSTEAVEKRDVERLDFVLRSHSEQGSDV